jgi:hypothetical protein
MARSYRSFQGIKKQHSQLGQKKQEKKISERLNVHQRFTQGPEATGAAKNK